MEAITYMNLVPTNCIKWLHYLFTFASPGMHTQSYVPQPSSYVTHWLTKPRGYYHNIYIATLQSSNSNLQVHTTKSQTGQDQLRFSPAKMPLTALFRAFTSNLVGLFITWKKYLYIYVCVCMSVHSLELCSHWGEKRKATKGLKP